MGYARDDEKVRPTKVVGRGRKLWSADCLLGLGRVHIPVVTGLPQDD